MKISEGNKEKIFEENFFRPKWYSVFINPYFIDRRSLLRATKDFSIRVAPDAKILDVGCGLKPYRKFFATEDYIGIDIEGGGHADDKKIVDKYYDGQNIPYPDGFFDVVLCTQVLQHAVNHEKLLIDCARVLRKDGVIFLTMPFMYPEHEVPYDFRRLTRFEHKKLLEKNGFNEIEIKQTTGFFGTFGQIFVIFLFEGIKFHASILKILLSIFILAPIQIISLLLDGLTCKRGPTINYVVTAKKK